MKELHTALFVAPTGVGKTHLALSLLENEYRNHFNFIVIICPTLRHNSAYKSRGWVGLILMLFLYNQVINYTI